MKQELIRIRTDLSTGGFGFTPKCAICGKLLHNGSDMHEAIITRGDIRGQPSLTEHIMVRQNCVLVCPGGSGSPCHRKADSKEGKIEAIKHLLMYEPIDDIQSFLDTMEMHMQGKATITEAKSRFEKAKSEVYHGEKVH